MIQRRLLKRLEELEVSILPEKRDALKVVVTNSWGIIDQFEIYVGDGRQNRSGPRRLWQSERQSK